MTERDATVRIGYFSRSPVLELARARGLFTGLAIEAEAVASSPAQFRSLAAGAYDLVLTSPDNVAAYRFRAEDPMDVRIVRAVDGGLGLSLLGAPGVRRVEDLRGRAVGVDVPDSGFAFALYELLASHGLRCCVDYELVTLGSTPRRAVALREGRCDATLLTGGFTVAAERAGLVNLGRISDVVHPYLGTVLAATGPWLENYRSIAERFCAAWQQAVDILLVAGDEVNPLLASVFNLPIAEVPVIRRILVDPAEGLVADGVVRGDALASVLRLRERYGSTPLGATGGIVDSR
jgi:ABC-type nitrate/sulfonate/bicarbonate transport system substrate-binding protein